MSEKTRVRIYSMHLKVATFEETDKYLTELFNLNGYLPTFGTSIIVSDFDLEKWNQKDYDLYMDDEGLVVRTIQVEGNSNIISLAIAP